MHIILAILLRYMVNLCFLCFTGPANLLGGFVFMVNVLSLSLSLSLSFLYLFFSSHSERKEREWGREHFINSLTISFVQVTDITQLGWCFSRERMSFVWQSILFGRLFLFLPREYRFLSSLVTFISTFRMWSI